MIDCTSIKKEIYTHTHPTRLGLPFFYNKFINNSRVNLEFSLTNFRTFSEFIALGTGQILNLSTSVC